MPLLRLSSCYSLTVVITQRSLGSASCVHDDPRLTPRAQPKCPAIWSQMANEDWDFPTTESYILLKGQRTQINGAVVP